MKRKGFTLIELLAVIVIIAIIAVISVPIILGVIDKSKRGALQDSAYGLLETANIYYAEKSVTGETTKEKFEFEDGTQISESKLTYKGKVTKGSLMLYSDGKAAVCIEEDGYVAIKNVDEEKVTIKEGMCQYNVVTDEYETIEVCSEIREELEKEKTKCNEEKEAINSNCENEKALLEEQMNTQKETYEQQLEAMRSVGTAVSADILTGKTAFSKGSLITGTMVDRGGVTSSINAGGSYTIPAGYHNGNGKVTGNSLASQTSATATTSNLSSGVTAWVNGTKITGNGSDNTAYYNSGYNVGYTNGVNSNNVPKIVGQGTVVGGSSLYLAPSGTTQTTHELSDTLAPGNYIITLGYLCATRTFTMDIVQEGGASYPVTAIGSAGNMTSSAFLVQVTSSVKLYARYTVNGTAPAYGTAFGFHTTVKLNG